MSGDNDEQRQLDAIRSAVRTLLQDKPHRLESPRSTFHRLDSVIREEIARALQPALNESLKRRPHAKYEEKKALAVSLNSDLREFGLAIRCPKTGHATFLQANPGQRHSHVGRFRLDRTDEQRRYTSTFSFTELPDFELMLNKHKSSPARGDRSR